MSVLLVLGSVVVRTLVVTGVFGVLVTALLVREPDDAATTVVAVLATAGVVAVWSAWDGVRGGYLRTVLVWALAAALAVWSTQLSDVFALVVVTMVAAVPGSAIGAVVRAARGAGRAQQAGMSPIRA